jgi:hypothetical protein
MNERRQASESCERRNHKAMGPSSGCSSRSTAQQVKLHLREDTPLDPVKLRTLIVKGGGPWRATPDMRLVRVFKEPGGNGLTRAEQMLAELATLGV